MQRLSASLSALAIFSTLLVRPLSAAASSGASTTRAPHGGTLVTLFQKESSPQQLLRDSLSRARGVFGSPIDVRGAVRSKDGTLVVALIRSRLAGAPIGGMILGTYVAGAPSRIALIYDRADRFAKTAPELIAFATTTDKENFSAPAAQMAGVPVMHDVVAPDRSASARLPAGWTPHHFAQGVFVAADTAGDEVDQEVAFTFVDPRSPALAQYVSAQQMMRQPVSPVTPFGIVLALPPDPVRAYVSANRRLAELQHQPDPETKIEQSQPMSAGPNQHASLLSGTSLVKGTRVRFLGSADFMQLHAPGAWMLSIKMVSAPDAQFKKVFPTLSAIFSSYKIDQNVRQQQVGETIRQNNELIARGREISQATIARNTAVFNASMSHAREVQDGIDRSTAGFSHYLNDTTVVQSSSGARGTIDQGFAQSMVRNDPQNFREVPVSEYRKGVDY